MEAIAGSLEREGRFNPFPGLRPFEPDEDHLFFGRERETDELLRRLRTNRFVSVLGTSGSGKSSLVRSGLIPSLHSGFMVAAGSDWRVALLRPGEDPIGNLAAALDHPDVLGDGGELGEAGRMLLESTLRRSDLGLADCARHARRPGNLLVVVDQFEELFRFRESRREHGSRDEAVAFAKLLLGAASQEKAPVYVVITMRSDFIGDCMEYPGLPEAINQGQYLIPRMTREELRQAITGPVAVGGGTIAPRLVTRLLNEVGDDPDQLPVLQHALMRTWDRWDASGPSGNPLDLAEYEAIGTMSEGLSRHAEEAYEELGDDRRRKIAERLFKALTDKASDGRGVRRPTAVSEVAALAECPESEVVEVVEAFRVPGRSFLMPPSGVALDGDSILDLSHESLMRNWSRLADWVEEETASGKSYRRLCRAARRYDRGEGSLWVDPELALGLAWKGETDPPRAWAARYDETYERALGFLEESRLAQEARRRAEQEARRAKLRNQRILAGVLGSAMLVTLTLGLFALRAGRIARAAEAEAVREAATAEAVSDFLVSLFEVADPEESQGATVTAQEILDEGARKIDAELAGQPAVQARMMSTIGKVYGSLGLFDKAEPLLSRARETAATALGADDPVTLEAAHRLAEVERERGQFARAEELHTATLEARRRTLGPEHPDTLRSLADLGRVQEQVGRSVEAEATARAALEARLRVLGEEHAETLESRHRLGTALQELGRYDEAEESLRAAWEGQRAALGDTHPDTLASMGSLGELLALLGRYDEAETIYADSREAVERVFGAEHPKALVAEQRLAQLQRSRGHWDEAERRMTAVLEARRRTLGPEHPSTLYSMSAVAALYEDQGRFDEALELATAAYEAGVRTLGRENPDVREHANILAIVYGALGRKELEAKLQEENLEVARSLYGEAHPAVFVARNNLAVALDNWGRAEQAVEMYEINLEARRRNAGVENPDGLIMLSNLAWSYNDAGRRDEAETLVQEMLDTSRRVLGEGHPTTLRAQLILGNVRRGQNRFEETEQLYRERLEGFRELYGDAHPETLGALGWLAGLYQQLSRNEEALALRKEILEGRRALYGEIHPRTINAYGSLAWAHRTLNQHDRALETDRRRLQALRGLATRENAGAHYKNWYAAALNGARRGLQSPEEALRFALEANGLSDYRNRDYVATLAEAYFKNGRVEDAIRTQEKALALVPEDDPGARTRLERRLAEFHEADGNPEPMRRVKIAEIAREREEAMKPGASPRARDRYAWGLLLADPPDLRDPEEAIRVALEVNEETGYENRGYLDTLALAYYLAGQAEKAVEIQERVVQLTDPDQAWAWPNMNGRLQVFRGEGTRDVDLARVLPGVWAGRVGPVDARVEFHRDRDHILGRSLVEMPWSPAGEIFVRFDLRSGELEFLKTDSGWTNPRWGQPADYRFTSESELIWWGLDSWFVVTIQKQN